LSLRTGGVILPFVCATLRLLTQIIHAVKTAVDHS